MYPTHEVRSLLKVQSTDDFEQCKEFDHNSCKKINSINFNKTNSNIKTNDQHQKSNFYKSNKNANNFCFSVEGDYKRPDYHNNQHFHDNVEKDVKDINQTMSINEKAFTIDSLLQRQSQPNTTPTHSNKEYSMKNHGKDRFGLLKRSKIANHLENKSLKNFINYKPFNKNERGVIKLSPKVNTYDASYCKNKYEGIYLDDQNHLGHQNDRIVSSDSCEKYTLQKSFDNNFNDFSSNIKSRDADISDRKLNFSNKNISSKNNSVISNNNQHNNQKRVRTIFTTEQLKYLEKHFEKQQYMVGEERLFLLF